MLMYKQIENLEVNNYSNIDFVGCIDSTKSIFDYIFMLASGAISWKVQRKYLVLRLHHMVYGWRLSFFGLKILDLISIPLRMYCESSTTVFVAKNDKNRSQNKHIDIKYLTIREHAKDQTIVVENIIIELMIVDILIKGTPPQNLRITWIIWDLFL